MSFSEGDGASYVDAATVALQYAAVQLGQSERPSEVRADGVKAPNPREFRDVMGSLVTGVCVLTTTTGGDDVAMTVNSMTSVSLDPPLVLVCVAREARFHGAIVESDSWGVSVLDADSAELSTRFARRGRDRAGQLDGLSYRRGAATGVALLSSSCATLECRTVSVYPGGDHSIVVGRVLTATRTGEGVHPLVFHRGAYSWLKT